MRNVHVVLVIAALTVFVGVTSFATRISRGQSPNQNTDTKVKPTILLTDRVVAEKPVSSILAAAAANNGSLRNELTWTFGSKQQHGWYLYDLLIGQTLGNQSEAATGEFASALASWQKKTGLIPSGVLDETSLMALVSEWQNNRLKNKTYATPDQLLTAPPSDFYDPERLDELRQVERTTYAAYKQLVAAAIADRSLRLQHTASGELAPTEKYFKIVSAFRSREYQEQLRHKSPNAGSAGLAVNSPHFTGKALDLYVGGDPVDTRDANRALQVNTPAYRWLVKNAARFGFRPYFYEPWHWEYVK